MKINKAVILAAGLGTRMLPMTKAIPKPMLPVVDRPVLEYIIEEATDSGVTEIAIVVNHASDVIMNHFKNYNNVTFISQPDFGGTANALYQAKSFTGNEPFALYYADEIVVGEVPCTKQLIDKFMLLEADVITAIEAEEEHWIKQYNSVVFSKTNEDSLVKIQEIIEKPTEPESLYTSIGRYIVSNNIYKEIEKTLDNHDGNEVFLTNAFSEICAKGKMYAVLYDGKRYDIGSKIGWLKTNLELGKIRGLID